ncbi:hypothetical protein P3517_00045 [Vibrio parahaemolyticus]|uniref:hypothetical protein n=1 Tax=Vibrio parahaemolyticus TaxID=670 RepID=UPI0008F8D726|nr:hypothetical protein [Vibrio parahaemolyticus]EHY0972649.1 hypothetical protein [Vibrio parahaemolyticus]EHZ7338467.1 hypothetical protein [Vibrio parahaemolyticus]EHZ7353724.1 hypothetical protein [Vibrio parahaemolyticus]EII5649198.1 hypothetical protein [Vibrio parahaemolyticus]EJG0879487.1 hypothetical protein [Vibrio parahaemolyticus]
MYSFSDEELTREKSLWDVFKLCSRLKPSNSQIICLLFVVILLLANALVLETPVSSLLRDVRKWAEFGFNFSITTIGFLIAGFTIFATLSKPDMMLAMMEHTNKETQLPTLKYNFFAFMKVFIAYIGIALFFLSIILFGQVDGLVSNVVSILPNSKCVKYTLVVTSYVYVGTSFVYLVMLLMTFIFNIYAIVMNFLRWEYHKELDREAEREKEEQEKIALAKWRSLVIALIKNNNLH